jgi:hypothetical protein
MIHIGIVVGIAIGESAFGDVRRQRHGECAGSKALARTKGAATATARETRRPHNNAGSNDMNAYAPPMVSGLW